MSKRTFRSASPDFVAASHRLSKAAKAKLIELLGYGKVDLLDDAVRHKFPGMRVAEAQSGAPILLASDPDRQNPSSSRDIGKIILDVEQWLGLYVNGSHHLDQIPRPADYVTAIRPLGQRAFHLWNDLCSPNLSRYYTDQLKASGCNLQDVELALASFVDAATKVVKTFEGMSSKGAGKNSALAEVVLRLRRIFRNYYKGPITGRVQRGAFVFSAEEEKRELEFVRTALRDARIIERKDTGQIRRLFRDPRCAVFSERAETIERIAGRTKPHSKRKQKRDS